MAAADGVYTASVKAAEAAQTPVHVITRMLCHAA